MILLRIEVEDEISKTDPVDLELLSSKNGAFLEVSRLGVRLMPSFTLTWRDGAWHHGVPVPSLDEWKIVETEVDDDRAADLVCEGLGPDYERDVDRRLVRAALDSARVGPLSLALEVMET